MNTIPPRWTVASATVAYLLSLPIMTWMYDIKPVDGGMHHLPMLMTGWFVAPLLTFMGTGLFNYILAKMPFTAARLAFLASCVGGILAWHGIPGWFAIGVGLFVPPIAYNISSKAWNNARALEAFDTHGG
jgi:hypothetical protein